MQDIQEDKKKPLPLSDIRIVETPAGSLWIQAGGWQPQSRLELAAYQAHTSLAKAFKNVRVERDLTIAVGETTAGKLIFAANEDSPEMRQVLQNLARKYQGHAIYRNDVRALARLLNIRDLFSIRQFHDAEAQIAFLEDVYKEHCLKLRSIAATRLICDKCSEFLRARGIEPATLLKEIAKENMKEFRRLLRNPAAAAQANQLLRSLGRTRVEFLRGNIAATRPQARSTAAIRGAAAVLLLIEIGKLVVQVISAAKGDENHQNTTLINQLEQLHARELAEGRLLVPVLKVNVNPYPVMEREPGWRGRGVRVPEWEIIDERNAQLAAAFDRHVYWEFESVEVSDYQRLAELAETTGQSASVAGKIIFPQFRSKMWNPYLSLNAPDAPLAKGAWEAALDAFQEGFVCLSIESRNEALSLRQLAASQADPDAEKQAEYRQKGFHWWKIPR